MGYSLEVYKELDTTEATQHVLFKVHVLNLAYKSLRDPAPPSPITLLPTLLGFCPLLQCFCFSISCMCLPLPCPEPLHRLFL